MIQPKKKKQSKARKNNFDIVYNRVTKAYDQRGIYLKSYPLLDQEERVEALKYGLILDSASFYNQQQANRMYILEKKVKGLQQILDSILANQNKKQQPPPVAKTQKQIWREWIQSPTGVAITILIGVLIIK